MEIETTFATIKKQVMTTRQDQRTISKLLNPSKKTKNWIVSTLSKIPLRPKKGNPYSYLKQDSDSIIVPKAMRRVCRHSIGKSVYRVY